MYRKMSQTSSELQSKRK